MPAITDYNMYCPIARALDVLGERWTLLILRDLSVGEQRFTDLRRSVVGIPPNVLSARLKALVEEGLVVTRELPPPAARTVYVMTERGREAIPVLRALATWGFPRLDADPSTPTAPVTVLRAAFGLYYEPGAVNGIDERYAIVIDGKDLRLSSSTGARPTDDRDPDLVLEGPSRAFLALRQTAGATLTSLIEAGAIQRSKGSARAQRNFERIFSLAAPARA